MLRSATKVLRPLGKGTELLTVTVFSALSLTVTTIINYLIFFVVESGCVVVGIQRSDS